MSQAVLALAAEASSDWASLIDPEGTVLESLRRFLRELMHRLPYVVVGLGVLIVTWVVANVAVFIAGKVLAPTSMRASLKDLFAKMVHVAIWLLGILGAAMVIFPTLTPGRLLATLGLGSIAIGFAFKDIFENFFAGVLILWRFPFEVGDYIECEEISGQVEEIWIRMTLIRQVDGQLLLVPNAKLYMNPTRVVTSQDSRRQQIFCGVAYGENVDEARDVIYKAVESCPLVASDKAVEVYAHRFGSSSIDFEVTWWAGSTPLAERKSRDQVVAAIKRDLDEAGIEIPFPYRTLTFKSPTPWSDQRPQEDPA